jgi:uncharacterized protein
MINQHSFNPPFLLKSSYLQTFLASQIHSQHIQYINEHSTPHLIDSGEDSFLLVQYSRQVEKPKGLCILVHGWEGSSDSAYIVRIANFFYKEGYNIARINMRDHGGTQSINVLPFNGSLVREVYEVIKKVAEHDGSSFSFIVGFSLGGNFAARIALKNSKLYNKIYSLKMVFAISPSINPKLSTERMDNNLFLGRYFLNVWKHSLIKKAKIFPETYSVKEIRSARSVMELTRLMVSKHTLFKNVDEYFSTYTLLDNYFEQLKTPLYMLSASDDLIVDVQDFYTIKKNKYIEIAIENYGGHNGFIESFQGDCYYIKKIASMLEALQE